MCFMAQFLLVRDRKLSERRLVDAPNFVAAPSVYAGRSQRDAHRCGLCASLQSQAWTSWQTLSIMVTGLALELPKNGDALPLKMFSM